MSQVLEEAVSEVLSSVVDDVNHAVGRNISGAELLHELLGAPWLRALLQIYECLLQFERSTPTPILPYASGLSHEIMSVIQKLHRPSVEARELYNLLSSPHIQGLLSSQDSVAQSDYGPVLPPLPDYMPEDEEAMRVICLVKNNQPLGATIRRDEETGEIYIARVIHGGLADRSGLLHPGDMLVEVNGNPVVGLEPEQLIKILINSQGTILFKVIPDAAQSVGSQTSVFMKAMVDYCPLQDSSSPCPNAGMAFSRGDVLEVVNQSDGPWWQARKLPCSAACAGLIPSASTLKSKLKEHWWCQPLHVHTCIRTLSVPEDDRTHAEDKHKVTELEKIHFDEDDADITDGVYLAGFRRSFRLFRRMSSRKRRQSCTSCLPSSDTLSTPYEEVALYQRPLQENPRLIILVGAAKVGVNELRKRLIKLNSLTFQAPVPHTSRPIRAVEQMGREYHFVTKELFEYMVCNHRFVEYGEYKSHLYGTSTDAIDEVLKRGRICIIDVEPNSIQWLRTKKLKPYVIFIKAPSPDRLRQTRGDGRILTNCTVNRAFTEEDFMKLEEATQLMEAKYKQLFDAVLVNDDLQDACMQLCSIIQAAQDEPQWIPVGWSQTDE
ncbi:MAGUK p55 subfamily member 4-like isoform X1 [Etheostoma cragini]|uniref:MAGUK p55 subfamily member 4-like isoform X1 n=2 Tax=Etheostoma cragini TaxID=417921 RepID=UPI00155F3982|nr:MAGUK p55 subfamily member 4-like isoform X1 [Etheostoma cragini]